MEFNGNQHWVSGVTIIKFRRKLVTGDSYDTPIENKTMNVAFAYNPTTDDMLTHGTKARTVININFFTGEVGVRKIVNLQPNNGRQVKSPIIQKVSDWHIHFWWVWVGWVLLPWEFLLHVLVTSGRVGFTCILFVWQWRVSCHCSDSESECRWQEMILHRFEEIGEWHEGK